MPSVVIVGGGVIGCATAYYLGKAGFQVTLIEVGELAGEASGAAAGILVPPQEAAGSGPFSDLCRAGVDVYPSLVEALASEASTDIQYMAAEILLPARSEPWARALRAATMAPPGPGLALEWVEGGALRRLEPGLADDFLGAAYSSEAHHVNPGALTLALAQAAQRGGADVQQRTAVKRFIRRNSRVVGVRTSTGDTVGADEVIIAAGPWTGRLAARLGVDIATPPMRGQMLAYRFGGLRHIVWGEDGYLVPKAGGFLFAGATVEDVGFRARTTKGGIAQLRRNATKLAPGLRHAEVASSWAGLRPGSPDGRPIIGRLPGLENVSVATGHFRNGILLGPITGRLVAQLILGQNTEVPLEAFSPARFG